MEASAGQVIHNNVRVWPIRVRVTAAFILIGPLQVSRGHGALGDLTVVAGVGGKPRFTAVVRATAKQNER